MTTAEGILSNIYCVLQNIYKYFIGSKALTSEQILSVTDTVATLTVPSNAKSCIIGVEQDVTGDASLVGKCVRFYESGSTPTASNGMFLGNLDTYEIKNYENMLRFKIIGTQAGKTHTLQVLYYE